MSSKYGGWFVPSRLFELEKDAMRKEITSYKKTTPVKLKDEKSAMQKRAIWNFLFVFFSHGVIYVSNKQGA